MKSVPSRASSHYGYRLSTEPTLETRREARSPAMAMRGVGAELRARESMARAEISTIAGNRGASCLLPEGGLGVAAEALRRHERMFSAQWEGRRILSFSSDLLEPTRASNGVEAEDCQSKPDAAESGRVGDCEGLAVNRDSEYQCDGRRDVLKHSDRDQR